MSGAQWIWQNNEKSEPSKLRLQREMSGLAENKDHATYRDVLVKALGPYRGYWKDGNKEEWAKQRQKDYEQVKADPSASKEDKAFADELMKVNQ